MLQKFLAIAFLPLIPVAFIIDVVLGDHVTGVTTTVRQKMKEHKEAWLRMWHNVKVRGCAPNELTKEL